MTKTSRKNIEERLNEWMAAAEKHTNEYNDTYVILTQKEFDDLKEKVFSNLNADLSKNLEVWTNTSLGLTWFRTWSQTYSFGIVVTEEEPETKEDTEMKMSTAQEIMSLNIKGAIKFYNEHYNGEADAEMMEEQIFEETMSNNWLQDEYTDEQVDEAINTVDSEWVRARITELNNTKEDSNMTKEWTREDARNYILNNYTVKEMREHLKDAGIKGMSKAKKDELVKAMLDLEEQKNKSTVEISKVKMYAFTSMYIGEFDAEVQDGVILVNTTSKGELMFDLNTGKEITDESKSRYANKVERA